MSKESLEELRERLIRDEQVRQMIRVRAYEIYQLRGQHPGNQAQDWFQAEDEVLAFLIAGESRRHEEKELQPLAEPLPPPDGQQEATPKKTRTRRASGSKQPASKGPATKRASSKKSTGRSSKPKRTHTQPKPEVAD